MLVHDAVIVKQTRMDNSQSMLYTDLDDHGGLVVLRMACRDDSSCLIDLGYELMT